MSGLKALLAQRAAQRDGANGVASGQAGSAAQPTGSASQSTQIPAEATPPSDAPNEAQAAKPKLGFLAKQLVKTPTAAAIATVESKAEPLGEEFDLSDLSAFEGDGKQTRGGSGFADELSALEATKPDRVVPDDADKGMLQFVSTMDSVYEVLDEPDMLGAVIRNIMVELKSYPHYAKMIAPEDVRTWVKSMRATMGLAKIKKTEAKTKRASGASKSKGSKHVDADMESAFKDLGINFDDV